MAKQSAQHKLYEFVPHEEFDSKLLVELASMVRIGVGGHVVENMSPELQKSFKEVKNAKRVTKN